MDNQAVNRFVANLLILVCVVIYFKNEKKVDAYLILWSEAVKEFIYPFIARVIGRRQR